MLIDTHTHVVANDAERYPQSGTTLANGSWWDGVDCSVERFAEQVDDSAVDAVVLVQAAGVYGDDNAYVGDAAASDADRFVASCIVDPGHDGADEDLARWAEHSSIGGVRLFHVPRPDPSWLASPAGDRAIDTAAALGLSVAVCCMSGDFDDLRHQLQRRTDVAIALDHCGFANFSGGAPFVEAQALWDLAQCSNLHVKLTPTLVHLMGADPCEVVAALVDQFGAERVMWGSDWPQHREIDASGQPMTYGDQVAMIQSWLSDVNESDRAAIAGGNALRLWPEAWSRSIRDQ